MLQFTFALTVSAISSVIATALTKRYSTTCGIIGFNKSPAYWQTNDPKIATFAGCLTACKADSNCLSFSFCGVKGLETCSLYNLPLIKVANPTDVYQYAFYDKTCTVELNNVPGTTGLAGPAQVCGLKAYDVDDPSYHIDSRPANANYVSCNAQCMADPNCHSFAFGNSQCLLYIVGAATNTYPSTTSPYTFYDKACPAPSS